MPSFDVHKPALRDTDLDTDRAENSGHNGMLEVDFGGNSHAVNAPCAVRASTENTNSAGTEDDDVRCWQVWRFQRSSLMKLVALVVLVGLVVAVFTAFDAFHWLMVFAEWSKDNEATGISAFIGIYILLTVLLFPAALLTIIAGLIFGIWKGTLAVLVGASVGSTCAFVVGRYLLKDAVDRNITRRFKVFRALNTVIKRSAFKFTFLVRLSPVVPFNWLNYALSVTSVPVLKYIAATFLGMVPGAVLFVYLGSTLMSFVEIKEGKVQSDDRTQILFYAGLGLTAVVTVVITRLARDELRKEILRSESEAEAEAEAAAASPEDGGSSIDINTVRPSHGPSPAAQEHASDLEAGEGGGAGAASIRILSVPSGRCEQPNPQG